MIYCSKCGWKNDDDAHYCIKCRTPLNILDNLKKETKDKKSIEEKIEETAEEIGKKTEEIGKKIEKKVNTVGRNINQWYDENFKIAGPLVGAFIALIILRIIILIIQGLDEDIFIVTALGNGLLEYLLVIFASMLLTGYNHYFYRKYKHQYQWIYPLISAIGFIIGAWIAAQIMLIISQTNNTPILESIGNFINNYLIGIFILALFISYIAQFFIRPYQSQEQRSYQEFKHCSKCNIDLDCDARYCWKCGNEL
jgi:hypothetical protein